MKSLCFSHWNKKNYTGYNFFFHGERIHCESFPPCDRNISPQKSFRSLRKRQGHLPYSCEQPCLLEDCHAHTSVTVSALSSSHRPPNRYCTECATVIAVTERTFVKIASSEAEVAGVVTQTQEAFSFILILSWKSQLSISIDAIILW